MPVKVYNNATQQVEEVDAREAQRGIQQGDYTATGKVRVAKGNRTGTVDGADLLTALGQGAELIDEQQAQAIKMRREEESVAGQIQGGIEAGLAGATLGLSSLAAKGLGADPERMRLRREVLGKGGTLLEIAGAAAPTFFTGGASLGAQAGGRGLAATLARATPAGLAARAGARLERGIVAAVPGSRILPAGARNFVEGAAQGMGTQLDENVLGDRELNADLLGSGLMGGVFGTGAGVGMHGLASVASGAVRAPIKGMQGILGRMNASSGGLASRDVAELMVREGGELSGGAKLWRDNAVRQGLDPDQAERLARMGDTRTGREDILRLERDGSRIEREATELVGSRLPSVHAQMDEARRLSGGESKSRYWERLGPKSREAQHVASKATDDLFGVQRGEVKRMIQENLDAAKTYGQGAQVHSVPVLMETDKLLNKLSMKLQEAEQLAGKSRSTQKAMALDEYKRSLGNLIDDNGGWGKMRMATPEVRATNTQLRRMYAGARDHLERTDLWGDAAVAQQSINAKYQAASQADDAFREAAGGTGLGTIIDPEKGFNAAKAVKLVRAHGRVGGDVTVARLMDSLKARMGYFDELAKHVDLDDAGTAARKQLRSDVDALENEFKRQAVDAGKLDDLKSARMMEGNKSPSLLTTATSLGGMLGFGVGGLPGAVLGAGVMAARQPHTSLVRYAALRNALDKADTRLAGAVSGMFKSAKELTAGKLKLPKVTLPRAPVGVAGRAAATKGSDTARASKRETALAKAAEISQSPEVLERALSVSMYDLHDVAPGLSGVMQQRVQKAAMFLSSKAPKVYKRPNSDARLVDPVSAASFERYLSTVTDPMAALDRFASGRITGEEAEAIRICYPALYADLQSKVQDEMANAHSQGREIPYDVRVRLGLLFQTPTDPSMTPVVANEIQAAIGASFDEPDAMQAMSGGEGGKPKSGKFSEGDRNNGQLQTSSERTASWRSA